MTASANSNLENSESSGLEAEKFYLVAAPSAVGEKSFDKGGKCGYVTVGLNGDIQPHKQDDGKIDLFLAKYFASEEDAKAVIERLQKNDSRALRQQQLEYAFNVNQLAAVEMYARVRPVTLTKDDVLQATLHYAAGNYEIFEESEIELIESGLGWLVEPPQLDLGITWFAGQNDDPGRRSVFEKTCINVVENDEYAAGIVTKDKKFDINTFLDHCRGWHDLSGHGLRHFSESLPDCGADGDSKLVVLRLFSNSNEDVSPLERPDMREVLARDLLARKLPEPVRRYALDRIDNRKLDRK